MRAHPVHGCHEREDHLRRAERHNRVRRETEALERRVDSRTNTVAKIFDRVRAVLSELGYLRPGTGSGSGTSAGNGAGKDTDTVTDLGRTLARIYTEQDLLVAECLRFGVWDALDPPALAGAVSALVFEPRGEDTSTPTIPVCVPLREALDATDTAAAHLAEIEARHQLSFLRRPETGFVAAAFAWASGRSLENVLTDTGTELTAGDFVRWMRQLIDLLDQIAQVAPRDSELRRNARAAIDAVRRGVVAYSATV
jgi:ATP-dependent RNA helicase HelY